MRQINGEAVVRLGHNFRNTRTVVNRLLTWRTNFLAAEAATGSQGHSGEAGRTLGQVWMRGIVEYFRERLEACFTQLDIQQAEDACVNPSMLPPVPARGSALATAHVDSEELVSRCIASARAVVTPEMSASPYFVRAVRTCREMVQVLQVVQGLLYSFSSHCQARTSYSSGSSRRAGSVEFNFSDDHLEALRSPQWLFRFILLFLGAMDLLQAPNRDTAVLTGHQLDYAIHCIACLVGEVDGKRKDSDVKATLDALVLGHVKNSCAARFPPQQTLAILAELRSNGGGDAAAGVADPLTRGRALLEQLLVRYPAFMATTTSFAKRNSIEEWGVSVMLAQLFCWDVSTPPQEGSAEVGKVRYHLPVSTGPDGHADDAFAPTVLYAMVREVLRPLLTVLLSVPATTAESGGSAAPGTAASPDGADGAGGDGAAPASGSAPLLSGTEQRLCALLLGVVAWLDSVCFADASRMTRWSSLDVGAQVMREFNMGRWCIGRVLREVLQDAIGVALRQIDEQVRASPAAATQEDVVSAMAAPVLQYLLRVERVWNALTEHAIELDHAAFDSLRELGATVMPKAVATTDFAAAAAAADTAASRASYDTGLLADYKYEFYDAVQACMKQKWPKHYADLLTDPLLHSVHVYLLRAECAAQRGVGPRAGGVAGPRGAPGAAGVKRPPPPGAAGKGPAPRREGDGAAPPRGPPEPELVVLATKEDLHGGLRVVRCIKNRDHFIHRYTISVRTRLLTRPAPDVITDADLEKNKKRCEQEVEQFLAAWLGDAALLKTVRELHSNYTPQSTTFGAASGGVHEPGAATGRDFKLATTVLDWRLWGDNEAAVAAATADPTAATPSALPTTAAELRALAGQAASTATSATAPLPFPNDALPFLEQMEQRYNSDHGARALRWDWNEHAFTSFTLLYPKENGRVTTVHGTLLLQRLFLAIAAYGRAGVELDTLAKRAGMDEKRILSVLKPCVDRDRLLVRIDGAGGAAGASRLALNYEWTRPANRPRGDFTYWPNAERRRFTGRTADQDATMVKRRNIIKTSIMQVMKQVQRIHHDELYATVREKNAKMFEVTVRNFKQEIEDLIGKDFMARSDTDANEYVFRA